VTPAMGGSLIEQLVLERIDENRFTAARRA
jgi:hypothetical protein